MRNTVLTGLLALLLGVFVGQQLPNTFFPHPLATLHLMTSIPPGSLVKRAPAVDTSVGPDVGEYGIVVGYEAVRGLNGRPVLLCLVRTEQGAGPLLAIDPTWLSSL
jgi:hypothetical protein